MVNKPNDWTMIIIYLMAFGAFMCAVIWLVLKHKI